MKRMAIALFTLIFTLDMGSVARADRILDVADPHLDVYDEVFVHDGHSYVLTVEGSWNDVANTAACLGGTMLTLNGPEEEQFVRSTLMPVADRILDEIFGVPGGLADIWLGLHFDFSSGQWRWESGEASTYTNWCPQEPNGCSQEYFALTYGLRNPQAQCWNNVQESGDGGCGGDFRVFGVIEFPSVISEPFTACGVVSNESTSWSTVKARFSH